MPDALGWTFLVGAALWLSVKFYCEARPSCDWCKKRHRAKDLYKNPDDLGWSDSNGLCEPCEVGRTFRDV